MPTEDIKNVENVDIPMEEFEAADVSEKENILENDAGSYLKVIFYSFFIYFVNIFIQ